MDTPSTGPFRKLLTAKFLITGGVLAVAGAAVVLIWFQPQKLFIDERVDEALPGAMEEEDAMAMDDAMKKEDDAMAKDDAMMSMGGSFRSIDHETTGTASLAKADDGHYYVRLEDFRTENGPDLVVYLSAAPASAQGREFAEDFIDLGALKGNIGNQNYRVPDDADLSKYRSVVIWCRRFTVAFGAAPIDAM